VLTASAAFVFPQGLLHLAVDGLPHRPQAHHSSGEPLPPRLRRLRLGPMRPYPFLSCTSDFGGGRVFIPSLF
jgi:hypothetical protein